MRSRESRQYFSGAVQIAAGAGATTLQASPGTDRRLVVTDLTVFIGTTAAQTFDIESSDGTVELLKVTTASTAVGTVFDFSLFKGISLPLNNGLVYTPSAAGYAITVIFEGYIEF